MSGHDHDAAARPRPADQDAEAAFVKWRAHAWRFGVLSVFLLVINLLTSPGALWFYWPMLGFAMFLLMRFPAGIDLRRIWQKWHDH